jgi:hypothetical protein
VDDFTVPADRFLTERVVRLDEHSPKFALGELDGACQPDNSPADYGDVYVHSYKCALTSL